MTSPIFLCHLVWQMVQIGANRTDRSESLASSWLAAVSCQQRVDILESGLEVPGEKNTSSFHFHCMSHSHWKTKCPESRPWVLAIAQVGARTARGRGQRRQGFKARKDTGHATNARCDFSSFPRATRLFPQVPTSF